MADDDILPGKSPLTLYRGDTYVWSDLFTDDATGDPLDLTGHVWVCQIRTDLDRAAPVVATIDVDNDAAATGTIVRTLTAGESANLGANGSTLYWDLQSDKDGVVKTWLAGKVRVKGDVSVGTDDESSS